MMFERIEMNIFELTFWEALFIESLLFILLLPIVLVFSVAFFVIKSSIKTKKSIFCVISTYRTVFSKARGLLRREGHSFFVIFSPFDLIFSSLNANAFFYKTIMISASWIEKLSLADPKWELAFYHTIGHELCHKTGEPKGSYSNSKSATFRNWVRECRADYYGISFVLRHNLALCREEILDDITMKAKHNTRKRDRSDSSHPTWRFRCDLLASHLSFDENAIKHIARACKIEDESEINETVRLSKI